MEFGDFLLQSCSNLVFAPVSTICSSPLLSSFVNACPVWRAYPPTRLASQHEGEMVSNGVIKRFLHTFTTFGCVVAFDILPSSRTPTDALGQRSSLSSQIPRSSFSFGISQGSDLKSTTRLVKAIIELEYDARDYVQLNSSINTLSKKHCQLKGAIEVMVELTMSWLDETTRL
jgi:hypothetical protein